MGYQHCDTKITNLTPNDSLSQNNNNNSNSSNNNSIMAALLFCYAIFFLYE